MISEKAIVSPKAQIGNNVTIYPFVYIEDDVVVGDNCIIYPFVSLMNGTRIGKGNKIHQNTVLGAIPQDFSYRGEATVMEIGDNNIIRENVVVNRATFTDGVTRIGNNNFIMEGVHISHDVKIGDGCVLGYGTKIAGDCVFNKMSGATHMGIFDGFKVIEAQGRDVGVTRRDVPAGNWVIGGRLPYFK